MDPLPIKFIFFGTDDFSIIILDILKKAGYIPDRIITVPDRPKGRGLQMTPPLAKVWGESVNMSVLQPSLFDNKTLEELKRGNYDLFIAASYGRILPKAVLEIPRLGILNVHPSLLPLYRGPSPIQTQILEGAAETGVTIMLLDEKMDRGPIIAQKKLIEGVDNKSYPALEAGLARLGGELLVLTLPRYVSGELNAIAQQHGKATYTRMIEKEDGLIDFTKDPEKNFRKYLAFERWPGVFFFSNGKRIKITEAEFVNGAFLIKKVIPEGKKEIDYATFQNTNKKALQ